MGNRTKQSSVGDSAEPGLPGGFRRGPSGFQEQFNGFLHDRLQTCAAVLAVISLLLFAVYMGLHLLTGYYQKAGLFDAGRSILLSCVGIALIVNLILRCPGISGRALRGIDLGLAWAVIAASTILYAATWENGPVFLIPILGLLLLTRAVVVPSRARWTLFLSLPAIPVTLVVQLLHDQIYANNDLPYSDDAYLSIVAWNQVVLFISIGLATVSSRVNFILRRRAYEAVQLGQYELEERIGRGAMGEVYRARHAMLSRPTAVKVIRAGIVDETTVARFELEVRQTARLTHPNTIAVYDYGRTPEGTFFYAMELLDGEDLSDIVNRHGPMPASRVIHILEQTCAALMEAHAIGLVHRDIKGGNLLLCRRGLDYDVVKVMDFGLVKDTKAPDPHFTGAGELCGTPETISPESLKGEAIGPRADLYAVGAVGCFLLSGQPIFDAPTAIAFVTRHLTSPPIPPSDRGVEVPADLERLLLQCLEKEPEDRPRSASALRAALLECAVAGKWSGADARAWWKEHRPRVRCPDEEPSVAAP